MKRKNQEDCKGIKKKLKNQVTDKESRLIKIVDLKDWKPQKQTTSVPIVRWSTSVQTGSMTLTLPKELYDKKTPLFGRFLSMFKNASLNGSLLFMFMSKKYQEVISPNRFKINELYYKTRHSHDNFKNNREKKIEAFKISILTGNRIDAVRRYLEVLQALLKYYVSRNMSFVYCVLQYFFDIDSMPARNTIRYFGFNCISGASRENEPISDYEDLSNLFRDKNAIRDNLDFDLCAFLNILERTNYVFPRKLQLLSREVRKVRNEFAHNLNEDFWTDEKCEKSIMKIDEMCQEVSRQFAKECSTNIFSRIMEIANLMPSSHIKRHRYQSMLEQELEQEARFLNVIKFIYRISSYSFSGNYSLLN